MMTAGDILDDLAAEADRLSSELDRAWLNLREAERQLVVNTIKTGISAIAGPLGKQAKFARNGRRLVSAIRQLDRAEMAKLVKDLSGTAKVIDSVITYFKEKQEVSSLLDQVKSIADTTAHVSGVLDTEFDSWMADQCYLISD